MAFRRRFRGRSRAPRRQNQWEWASGSDNTDLLIGFSGSNTGGNSAFWLRPPAGVVDSRYTDGTFRWQGDVTLVNMRVWFNARAGILEQGDTSVFPYTMNMGIIKLHGLDDVAPNPDETPDPSNGGEDWIIQTHITSVFHNWGGIQGSFGGAGFFESKAKRKIDINEGLLMIVNLTTDQDSIEGTGVEDVGYNIYARWLVKLP